jgi:hypothetical protein
MTPIASSIRVQDLDHCGIVAGIIDQMGLVEQINQELGTHPQEIVSAGVAVKAMLQGRIRLSQCPAVPVREILCGQSDRTPTWRGD